MFSNYLLNYSTIFIILILKKALCQDMPPPILENFTTTSSTLSTINITATEPTIISTSTATSMLSDYTSTTEGFKPIYISPNITTESPIQSYPKNVTTKKPLISNTHCYYKTQQSWPQWKWTCEGLQIMSPLYCYRCCYFEGINPFAGCEAVHSSYCNIHQYPVMNTHRMHY